MGHIPGWSLKMTTARESQILIEWSNKNNRLLSLEWRSVKSITEPLRVFVSLSLYLSLSLSFHLSIYLSAALLSSRKLSEIRSRSRNNCALVWREGLTLESECFLQRDSSVLLLGLRKRFETSKPPRKRYMARCCKYNGCSSTCTCCCWPWSGRLSLKSQARHAPA